MGTNKVVFDFSIKSDNFNTKVAAMNKEMRTFQEQIKRSSLEVVSSGEKLNGLSQKYAALNQALENAKSKVAEYEKQIVKQNANIEKSKTKLTELSKKKEEVNQKYEESVKATGKESEASKALKEELDKLTKQYKNTEKSITSKEKTLMSYGVGLEQAKTQVSQLEKELTDCSQAIQEQSNQFAQASKTLHEKAEKYKTLGGTIDNISGKILTFSTVILGAIGSLGTMSFELENGISKINTLVDDSGTSLERYTQQVVDLSNRTGVAIGDLTNSLYDAISAGVDYGDSIEFIDQVNKMAVGGFTDIGSASSLMTQVMNIYNKSVEEVSEVSDKLFLVQKNGVTTIGELASSMGEAMTMGASYNVSLENILASYASLTKQGRTASTAQTQLKAAIQELGDTGSTVGKIIQEKTGKSFSQLSTEGKSLYEVLNIIKQSCNGDEDAFNNLWSSTEAGLAAMSLLSNEGRFFNETLNEMGKAAGLTDKAFDKMASTQDYKLKKALNELKNSFIQLGKNATPLVEGVTQAISKLAEVIGEMDSETVKSITTMALWGAGLGAVGKVTGTTMKSVGSCMEVLSKLSTLLAKNSSETKVLTTAMSGAGSSATLLKGSIGFLGQAALPIAAVIGTITVAVASWKAGQEVLNGELNKSREEYSLLERGMAALMGVQLQSKEELQELGIVYKDFNENISEGFQTKVKDMTSDIHEFNLSLRDMNLDGIFDESEVSEVTNRVDALMDGIISTMESKSNTVKDSLYEMYSADGLIDESEQQLIDYWEKRTNLEAVEANELRMEILAILNQAKNRELTAEEIKNIENYYAQIKQLELQLQADNSYELEYAKSEFQQRIAKLDAEGAQTLLQERYKQYEEQNIATNAHYDALIQTIQNKGEELNEEDLQLIRDHETARNQQLESNKKAWDEAYEYALQSNKNLAGVVSKYNGEILDNTDRKFYDMLELYKTNYEGINNITETGFNLLYDKTEQAWKGMYVVVDEQSKEIIGAVDTQTYEIGAYNEEIKDSVLQLATEWQRATEGMKVSSFEFGNAHMDTEGNILNSNGEIIGSFVEVENELGEVEKAILSVNGTPVFIGENAEEVKSKLSQVRDEANALDGKKATITVDDGGTINSLSARLSGMWNNLWGRGSAFATGTSSAPEGVHNINEKGWELIDTPHQSTAVSLSRAIQGEMAYIPEGTRIQTHLSSTQQMQQEIRKEVATQTDQSNQKIIQAINQLTQLIKNQKQQGLSSQDVLERIVLENNVIMNDKVLSREIAPLVQKDMYRYSKRREG
ncbi:phage tail tape measure protein [Turicibacter sanguinis]|uniref:phage tail tape measure protein n=3 Tax=Turicibacter sanguinis TaxID=154288 RepID=UPI002330BDDF|nr:phage tail tape measure protein [Turicibacter sanguinis]MDB8575607.1 phage tail tape measure protein [Turicibacter sanguinis]MDB8578757.1 phage tail tape measure protein [Turicibacter sanguinis]MDB8584080.1 phage tail tape measure protein [Turicibacter sanguinis]MDB8588007.1 phage tail tape measure protein [Turicibacter sanguinis]MDB8598147.1 phage tail tape measure protein [Turicibacter sanguinis]